MAIPNITKQSVLDALKYIDENGIPSSHQSTQYDLVTAEGRRYPPKYVIAVADHLANGSDISTDGFVAAQAKDYLSELGFQIEPKLEKYVLTITADNMVSTDERFDTNHLQGDDYRVLLLSKRR